MRLVLLILPVFLLAVKAAPQHPQNDQEAVILRYENENLGLDSYRYNYETSNGISAQEEGQLKNVGTENEIMAVRGEYSFIGLDGITYTVVYIADENGFQPQGAHLPQPH